MEYLGKVEYLGKAEYLSKGMEYLGKGWGCAEESIGDEITG